MDFHLKNTKNDSYVIASEFSLNALKILIESEFVIKCKKTQSQVKKACKYDTMRICKGVFFKDGKSPV